MKSSCETAEPVEAYPAEEVEAAKTRLQLLCRNDVNLPEIKSILAKFPFLLNEKSNFNSESSIFSVASAYRSYRTMRFLMSFPDLDVNSTDALGNTPLLWASYMGWPETIKNLLEDERTNIHAKSRNGETAYGNCCKWTSADPRDRRTIHQALKAKERQLVESGRLPRSKAIFLDIPEEPHSERQECQAELASLCKNDQHLPRVREILVRFPELLNESCSSIGQAPLMIASSHGAAKIVRFLLELPGLDPNRRDNLGHTPLLWASYMGNEEMVRLLLTAPAIDLAARDNARLTAFEKVCGFTGSDPTKRSAIRRLLMAKRDELVAAGKISAEAVTWANQSSPEDEELQESRDLLAQLCRDTSDAQLGQVRRILRARPSLLNEPLRDGQTALHIAAGFRAAGTLRLLLGEPALDVNRQNPQGSTAVMWACYLGNTDIVRLLLTHPGHDLGLRDGQRQTALDKCCGYTGADPTQRRPLQDLLSNYLSAKGQPLPDQADQAEVVEAEAVLVAVPIAAAETVSEDTAAPTPGPVPAETTQLPLTLTLPPPPPAQGEDEDWPAVERRFRGLCRSDGNLRGVRAMLERYPDLLPAMLSPDDPESGLCIAQRCEAIAVAELLLSQRQQKVPAPPRARRKSSGCQLS